MHGTFANADDNWQAASPLLANHGYCVFTFNDIDTATWSAIPDAQPLLALGLPPQGAT